MPIIFFINSLTLPPALAVGSVNLCDGVHDPGKRVQRGRMDQRRKYLELFKNGDRGRRQRDAGADLHRGELRRGGKDRRRLRGRGRSAPDVIKEKAAFKAAFLREQIITILNKNFFLENHNYLWYPIHIFK